MNLLCWKHTEGSRSGEGTCTREKTEGEITIILKSGQLIDAARKVISDLGKPILKYTVEKYNVMET